MSPSINIPYVAIRRALLLMAVLLIAGCGSPEDRAQNYYERGMKLLEQKDYVKAGIEFKNALQHKKDMVLAWRGLLEIEQSNRNAKAIVPILRTIVELDKKDIVSRLNLGGFYLAGGATDQALAQANAALEIDSRHPGALALKAAALLKGKDEEGAKREAQVALEIDRDNVEATIVLAGERMARGDLNGALQILDQHTDQEKNLAIQLFKLQIFERSKDIKQAGAMLRKLAEQYPNEAAFRRGLVRFYISEKRTDEAEKELRGLAAANPTSVEAGLDVVRFLRAVKGPNEARQELVTRINAGGEVFQYQMALAELDFVLGNFKDSVQLLEKLASSAGTPAQALAAKSKLAGLHFSRNNFDAAEALVAEILSKDNRNTEGLGLRALIRMQRGQLDAAINDLRQALNDQPRSFDLMQRLATAYERSGSIELAEKQHADATQASNYNAGVSLNYVTFLRRRGNVERAEDVLTELANRWPNNVAVLSALAEVRLARQNWAGAQAIAEKIREIGDDRGLADKIMGVAFGGRNQLEDSIKALQSAYTSDPTVRPMAALVNAMVRAQQLDKAITFLQTALESNPGNAEGHVLMGSVLLLKNQPDQALKSFQTAIEKQPKDMAGYLALADFYVRSKKNDEAEKVIRSGLKEQPDNFAAHLALAGIMELNGNYEAAIAEYEYMLKQQPGSMITINNLASLLTDHRPDKAGLDRAYSLAVVLRKSEVPSFKDTLGWIYYLRGDYRSAIALLEEAAGALPNHAVVQYHLGMAYIADRQLAKASEQLKKSLTLATDAGLQQKIRTAQDQVGN